MNEPLNSSRESALRNARPTVERTRRIVAGALQRSEAPRVGWLIPVVAAATVTLALVVGWQARKPRIDAASLLESGSVAKATDVPATFRAGDHEIRLETDSEVKGNEVDAANTALSVVRGAASFHVRHLKAGERFWVTAGGVTVEAVGTRFDVSVEGPCARVTVAEGRVEVRRAGRPAEYLSGGENHVYCERPEQPEVLTDEDRLVFGALDAVRRSSAGDLRQAQGLFQDYLGRFPHSAYEEEALYYLARIAQRLGEPEEATAWAQQLRARFPKSQRAAELDASAKGK